MCNWNVLLLLVEKNYKKLKKEKEIFKNEKNFSVKYFSNVNIKKKIDINPERINNYVDYTVSHWLSIIRKHIFTIYIYMSLHQE